MSLTKEEVIEIVNGSKLIAIGTHSEKLGESDIIHGFVSDENDIVVNAKSIKLEFNKAGYLDHFAFEKDGKIYFPFETQATPTTPYGKLFVNSEDTAITNGIHITL